MVEATLDLDELSSHNFVIKPEFDPELQEYRATLNRCRDGLDAEHKRVGKELGFDSEKKLHMENHASYGYSFRLTRNVGATSAFPSILH